jgi:hypothetical protein
MGLGERAAWADTDQADALGRDPDECVDEVANVDADSGWPRPTRGRVDRDDR